MNEATTTLTPEEVARGLHVAPGAIVQAIEEGRLAAERIGDSYTITLAQLQAFTGGGNPFTAGVNQLPTSGIWRHGDSDEKLMERVQAGDNTAFDSLYQRHYKDIRVVCGNLLRGVISPYDEDDFAQEAMLRAYEHIGQFRPGSSVKRWLVGIAVHACTDHLRRQRKLSIESLDERVGDAEDAATRGELQPAPGPTPEDEVLRQAEHDAVKGCLSVLTTEERIAVWARYAGEETLQAIADSIGKSITWVRKLLSRALPKLRNCLRGKGFEIDEKGA